VPESPAVELAASGDSEGCRWVEAAKMTGKDQPALIENSRPSSGQSVRRLLSDLDRGEACV
jgi:hypothetical protein